MVRSARLFRYTIVKPNFVGIPSDLPPCCPATGANENFSRYGDKEESFNGVNPDFSELMDFDEVMGGKLTTSGIAPSYAEKTMDGFDMDLYPFSLHTSRLDSGLATLKQSSGVPAHDVLMPLQNRQGDDSRPSLKDRLSLTSTGVSVMEQPQSRTSLDNESNRKSSSDAVEMQNLLSDPQYPSAVNIEGYELVDAISGSSLGSPNPRTIITLEEAEPKTVMEIMNIALRSNAKVKFENC